MLIELFKAIKSIVQIDQCESQTKRTNEENRGERGIHGNVRDKTSLTALGGRIRGKRSRKIKKEAN